MLQKPGIYYTHRDARGAPAASVQLERDGYVVLRQLLSAEAVATLHAELTAVFAAYPRDNRAGDKRSPEEDEDFRYEMLNRSAAAQATVGHPELLAVIEPLLGPDCHVIANTCWRNPPRASNAHGGGFWHIDSGPHVPRPPDVPWDARIPYPVFAVGAHIYVEDCPLASGPTGVLPGSHQSGNPPPADRLADVTLQYQGQDVVPLVARAGDVALFVSDVWHRRLPCLTGDQGRFFLQAHYGRRDIAQRLRPTAIANQVSDAARKRATGERERTLIGLHPPLFYDG